MDPNDDQQDQGSTDIPAAGDQGAAMPGNGADTSIPDVGNMGGGTPVSEPPAAGGEEPAAGTAPEESSDSSDQTG